MFMSLSMTLFAILVIDNVSFIITRCLQGLFTTASQCIGPSFIHDMYFITPVLANHRFFFHEHTRKIGIWTWAFVISPYLDSFLSAVISNYKPWRTTFWIDFVIVGLALTFATFFDNETIYNRDHLDELLLKPIGFLNYKMQMLTGIYGAKCKGRTTVWQSTKDLFYLLTRPDFLCLCCISVRNCH